MSDSFYQGLLVWIGKNLKGEVTSIMRMALENEVEDYMDAGARKPLSRSELIDRAIPHAFAEIMRHLKGHALQSWVATFLLKAFETNVPGDNLEIGLLSIEASSSGLVKISGKLHGDDADDADKLEQALHDLGATQASAVTKGDGYRFAAHFTLTTQTVVSLFGQDAIDKMADKLIASTPMESIDALTEQKILAGILPSKSDWTLE